MVIVYGTRYFGAVDHMPDGSYVATKFVHAMYLPLIPLSSFWITSKEGNQYRGFSIPMSGKSVLVAYLRLLMLAAAIFSLVVSGTALKFIRTGNISSIPWGALEPDSAYYMPLQIGIAVGIPILVCTSLILLYRWMKKKLQASDQRQQELLEFVRQQS